MLVWQDEMLWDNHVIEGVFLYSVYVGACQIYGIAATSHCAAAQLCPVPMVMTCLRNHRDPVAMACIHAT